MPRNRTHRFFVDPASLRADPVVLDGSVARQLTRVLRLAVDDRVTLFCGDGEEHEAEIVSIAGPAVQVRIRESREPEIELRCALEFGLGILKGEKLDWSVQKLSELGVTRICFLATERQVAGAREERWGTRMARLAAIAREAVEQCGRVRLPELRGPMALSDFLRESAGLTLITDPSSDVPLETPLPERLEAVRVLVGPEGGFSPEEIEVARATGALAVSLGARVLRSETAAIAAASRISARFG